MQCVDPGWVGPEERVATQDAQLSISVPLMRTGNRRFPAGCAASW